MPIVKGVYVLNGTLTKVPDPAVDNKLRVRDVPELATDGSPKKQGRLQPAQVDETRTLTHERGFNRSG